MTLELQAPFHEWSEKEMELSAARLRGRGRGAEILDPVETVMAGL